ncbi:MAG: N-6 DNA methylase, partial [Candidatus Bathyarchaeota archaeon]|nr:N-6 DNA methylase [Candidatus Bathyarchaeota archaeon]
MAIIPESSVTTYERVKRSFSDLGYVGGLLQENYKFADILSSDLLIRSVQLATFVQEPPSYHTACFGVVIANGLNGSPLVSTCQSLGASQIIEITQKGFCRWKIQAYGNPILLDEIESSQIDQFFQSHKDDWSRNNLVRVKSALPSKVSSKLDFFDIGLLPLLDHEVQVRLDKLLTQIISVSLDIIKQRPSSTQEVVPALFRLIFRLIAAKVFSDRQQPGNWLQDDPQKVIREVEKFYFSTETPEPVLQDELVQETVWNNIRKAFHFHNLSVEVLAYVYENTMMPKEARRATGTHGTPPPIAEYIVRHLPFDSLQENQRHVFEPFSGHAVFLVAAMRRLRELLPAGVNPSERHNYFKSMLSGLELDDFAREVARLSLMLADYPNPNGWNVYRGDAFDSPIVERELSSANIVLCNPPFEDFTRKEQAQYSSLLSPHKPAAILQKVLQKPPHLLGFVLPRVFIFGRGYKDTRNLLSQIYSSIEILALPDNVFRYSEADTVLLIASGHKTDNIHLTVGQVY